MYLSVFFFPSLRTVISATTYLCKDSSQWWNLMVQWSIKTFYIVLLMYNMYGCVRLRPDEKNQLQRCSLQAVNLKPSLLMKKY